MSAKSYCDVMAIRSGITSSEKFVLLALAEFGGDEGFCNFDLKELTSITLMTDEKAVKTLNSLIKKRLIFQCPMLKDYPFKKRQITLQMNVPDAPPPTEEDRARQEEYLREFMEGCV